MAINPLISLQGRGVDVGGTISNALLNTQRIQDIQQTSAEAPLRSQLLETQAGQAQQGFETERDTRRFANIDQSAALLQPQLQRAIETGDDTEARTFLQNNIADIEARQAAGEDIDSTESIAALTQLINEGPQSLFNTASDVVNTATRLELFSPAGGVTSAEQRAFETNIANLSPEEQEKARRIKVRIDAPATGSAAQTIAKEELTDLVGASQASIAGDVETAKGKSQIVTEDVKQVTKINNTRIAELNQLGKGRASSTKKAKQFLRAIESGKAFTGATRTAASFIPGVFSTQAEFDEKFNAFSEVAARQKLKAAGEIRPTDADVEGMKRAIFGVGRDENVNIQLLQEFISDQDDADDELDDLLAAKKRGEIGSFRKTVKPEELQTLTDEDLFNF